MSISQIDLASIVHPRDGHKKVIAVLEAYLDESGIHEEAQVCVVAGYFGGPGQWKKTKRAWENILQKFDVPFFHAKEFWSRTKQGHHQSGPYSDWDAARDERFLNGLIEAIRAYKIYPVAAAIFSRDFFTFSLNQRKYLTGAQVLNGKFKTSGAPSKPYFVPFQRCVVTVAGYAESKSLAHFFFGLGKAFSGYALEYFAQIKTHPQTPYAERLGDIDFPLAAKTPELQCADLLSHLMYQHALDRFKDNDAMMCKALSRCLGRIRNLSDHPIFDRSGLHSLLGGPIDVL